MKTIIISLIAICCFTSCNRQKNKIYAILERVDSLCLAEDYETADSLLAGIKARDIQNNGKKALYYLLKTQTELSVDRSITNDSLITFCVDYYEHMKDYENLARAYYYKGIYLYYNDRVDEAIIFIKKAEKTVKKAKNDRLRYLIYANLSYLNSAVGANRMALEYAQKALAYAVKQNNISGLCFAYNCIASSYEGMGMMDSAIVNIKRIRPYLNRITDKMERAGYMTNIGYACYENGLYHEADTLLRQAAMLYQAPMININLAKNCYMLGKDHEADSLVKLINNDASFEERAELSQFLAERAESNGDYEASTRLYRQAKALEDSAARQKRTEERVTMQRDYEREEYAKSVRNKEIMWTVTAVIVAALLAAGGLAYHRKTVNRAKKTIADADRKIKEYNERLAALERQDSRHTNEVKELERKIRRLKDEQTAVINSGQALYNDIMAGGTVATWRKKEFDEFIEYYRVCRPEAVAGVESGYSRLSSTHVFYLLLADMGRDDDEVRRILGMTAGAVRTMKSRIRARRTAAS